jgi:hypothetical protein
MPFVARHLALAAIMIALAGVGTAACDDTNNEPAAPGSESRVAERTESLPFRGVERTRNEVLDGARRDFDAAIQGPPGFDDCFIARFRRELTQERLGSLIATHRKRGEAAAARALNGLGAPVGDACGGRHRVPQLIEAATGLRSER